MVLPRMRSGPWLRGRFCPLTLTSGSPGALWLAAATLILAGCGHPATSGECDELFAKSAELELRAQNITDPKTIADRTTAARATPKGSEFTGRCRGKRITPRALECVRRATSADQVDGCF